MEQNSGYYCTGINVRTFNLESLDITRGRGFRNMGFVKQCIQKLSESPAHVRPESRTGCKSETSQTLQRGPNIHFVPQGVLESCTRALQNVSTPFHCIYLFIL